MHELPEAGPRQRSRNPRVGTFHAPTALCLRQHIGQAQDEAGLVYEVSICPGGSPHVISKQSGRQWTLSWDELVKLAIGAGIDAPYPGLEEVQARGPSAAPHAFVAPAGNASPTYCAECGQYSTHAIHNLAPRGPKARKPAQLAPPEGLVLTPEPATTRVAAVVAGGAVLEAGQPIPPHPFGAEKDAPPQPAFTGREIQGDLLALHETLAEYGVKQARCPDEACEICGSFDRRRAAQEGRPPFTPGTRVVEAGSRDAEHPQLGRIVKDEGDELWIRWDRHKEIGYEDDELDPYGYEAAARLLFLATAAQLGEARRNRAAKTGAESFEESAAAQLEQREGGA